jgi:lysophospholipase L1-like esterase
MNKTLMNISLALNLVMLTGLIMIGSKLFTEKPPVMKEVQRWSEEIPVPDSITIAMLGNSLTAYADWNELLGRNDVQNFGIADFSMKQLSWILADWVIASKPIFCFVNGGQEDIMLGVPLERIADDYSMILDSLQHNGIKPIVQSTLLRWENPEVNSQVVKLNQLLKAICFKKNISFINLNTVLSKNSGLNPQLTTDGMHLNSKGYELWAIMIKDYLLLNNPRKNL